MTSHPSPGTDSTPFHRPGRTPRNANQTEESTLSIDLTDRMASIRGYQSFQVDNHGVHRPDRKLGQKAGPVQTLLEELTRRLGCRSLADLGCSQGYYSFLAHFLGYTDVQMVEHDDEYVEHVQAVVDFFAFDGMTVRHEKFGVFDRQVDVTLMLALIHWVYSCTALYGDLGDIIDYVAGITGKALIIEWIDPEDAAVQKKDHIGFNQSCVKSAYSRENFVKALNERFSRIDFVLYTSKKGRKTRELLVAYK